MSGILMDYTFSRETMKRKDVVVTSPAIITEVVRESEFVDPLI
jgi:hypothetical protein